MMNVFPQQFSYIVAVINLFCILGTEVDDKLEVLDTSEI